jgi:hypothetical protein
MERCGQEETKTKVLSMMKLFHTYLQASLLEENRQMQQTPSHLSSLTTTLVIDKTSSLPRHDSSEQLPPLA